MRGRSISTIPVAGIVAILLPTLQRTPGAIRVANATLTDVSSLLQTRIQQPPLDYMRESWLTFQQWLHRPTTEKKRGVKRFHEPSPMAENDSSDMREGYNLTEWDLDAPTFRRPILFPGEYNLCLRGHFVPELILIGVIKAGTTSFAADMRQNPNMLFSSGCTAQRGPGFCEDKTAKEAHFFDEWRNYGIDYMARTYPKCRTDVRMVATDETPRYLLDRHVPATIAKWYGPFQIRIRFVAILREPVARFQSDFYHAKVQNWCNHFNKTGTKFVEVVDNIMTNNHWYKYTGGNHDCSDRLEASLYPQAFMRWFATFKPSQFMIVPFLHLVDPGHNGRSSKSVVETVLDLLKMPHGEVRKGTHFNAHEHPSLIDDLGETKLQEFRSLINIAHGPEQLAIVLVHNPGALLFDYNGKSDDMKAIHDWLVSNW